MKEHLFRVRVHRPHNPANGGPYPKLLTGAWAEPAEAADAAEQWLEEFGLEGQSYADLLFNGDPDPQTSIFFSGQEEDWPMACVFGVWNRATAPWPIDYMNEGTGDGALNKLEIHPSEFLPALPEEADDGAHKKSDESDTMKLDGEDDDPDDYEGDEDDAEEDMEEADEDGADPGDDPGDEDGDSENEGDEEGEDSEPEESGGDSEIEDEEDGEEDGEDSEEGHDEDAENDSDDADGDGGDEPVRLPIFAKMRGPKGWRKRANAEELNQRNVFGFKVGVTDPDGETPGQQEKNVRAEIQFVEQDDMRDSGVLRLKLPDGVSLDDFAQLKSGWIIVKVPYTDEGA